MEFKRLLKTRKSYEEKIVKLLQEYERKTGSAIFAVGFVRTQNGIKIIINNGAW